MECFADRKNDDVSLFRLMVLIRRFEERVDELFAKGVIRGTTHLSAGQEAVAAGTCGALRPTDMITSNHRGHGHFLAKGGDPRRIMAELFGRETGYSRGRGGSQHMACPAIGFLGSSGVTGGSIPVATGVALAIQLQQREEIVLCFFGDGAVNQGAFHESLNMAAIWKLPVVYLCENNQYAMSTPFAATSPVASVADRAAAYAMPSATLDGNEVLAVKDGVTTAVARARRGEGPTLVECKTYRTFGHSKSDPRFYRTRDEEESWQARDPIELFRTYLLGHEKATVGQLEHIEKDVAREIAESVAFAEQSAYPCP